MNELAQRLSTANPPPVGLPRRRVRSYIRLRVWRQGQAFAAFDPKANFKQQDLLPQSGHTSLNWDRLQGSRFAMLGEALKQRSSGHYSIRRCCINCHASVLGICYADQCESRAQDRPEATKPAVDPMR
jgi:hypothetical protein